MHSNLVRLLALCFVSLGWAYSQDPSFTIKVEVPLVLVDVSVMDGLGNWVNSLSREDFAVYEDGAQQEIHFFSPVSAPYNILLLFDRSGSTANKWAFMQQAAAGFINNLRPQDQVAIGTFDAEFRMLITWTDPRSDAVLALADLIRPHNAGGTVFYRALERAVRREFRKAPLGRRVLVVLTDGRDTSLYRQLVTTNVLRGAAEEPEYRKMLKAVREQRIPIYFVALNTDKNLDISPNRSDEYRNLGIIFPESTAADDYLFQVRRRMEEVAEVSGGRILFPKEIGDIVPLYEEIGRELGVAYSLGYAPTGRTQTKTYRKIEVKTRNDRLRIMQSRVGYYRD